MSSRSSILARLAPLFVSVAVLLSSWQAAASLLGLPRVVLPGPLDVLEAFRQHGPYIARNVAITAAEALGGFFAGSALAIVTAFFFTQWRFVRSSLYPLALMLKTTPLIVLAPLLVIWLGSGVSGKVVMAGILVFFPVLVATYDGLRHVDGSYVELLQMHGARRVDILFRVRFPFALPQLFSGLRVAVPLSVVGATVAEYTGAAYGVGQVIASASYHLETGLVFACIFSISITSLTFFGLVCLAERRYIFWSLPDKSQSFLP